MKIYRLVLWMLPCVLLCNTVSAGLLSGMGSAYEAQRKSAQEELEFQRRYLEIQRQKNQILRDRQAAEIEQMKREIAEQQMRDSLERENKFWDDVYRLSPDYPVYSNNPIFLKWLNELDPISDISRLAYLKSAIDEFSVERVAAIVNEFKFGSRLAPAASKLIASSDEIFYIELSKLQPYWSFMKNDPDLSAWLQTFDPKTGVTFQGYLNDAISSRDVSRTERILAAYLLSRTSVPPYMTKPSDSGGKTRKNVRPKPKTVL